MTDVFTADRTDDKIISNIKLKFKRVFIIFKTIKEKILMYKKKKKTKKRRNKLLEYLKESENAVIGSELAEKFEVSRQVIVQDIALLIASGEKIVATSLGMPTVKTSIACCHKDDDELRDELETIVNYGGRIIDVKVEHPIYGELSGNLMISSIEDVDKFITNYQQNQASLLSELTDGVHLHTVEAVNEQVLEKIKTELKQKGYLLES